MVRHWSLSFENIVTALLLGFIFLLSVFLRRDHFGYYLYHHHTAITAHALATMEIWEQNGVFNYYAAPVYTPNNPGDKRVTTTYGRGVLFDSRGNLYYVSYPPLSFLLPFLLSLGHAPSVVGLQVISIILHLIGAVGVYSLVMFIAYRSFQFRFLVSGFIAYTLYVFHPYMLWFGFQVYFADMLVQVIWIWGTVCVLAFYKFSNKQWFISLCVLSVLGVWTEWLGLFFAAVVGVLLLILKRFRFFFIYSSVVVIAVLSVLIHYSFISGFSALLNAYLDKFSARSGLFGAQLSELGVSFFHPFGVERIVSHYFLGFSYLKYVSVGVVLVCSTTAILKRAWSYQAIKLIGVAGMCLIIPVLLHHGLFFNFTAVHDFSTIKSVVLASAGIGISLLLFERYAPKSLSILLGLVFILYVGHRGIELYRVQNPDDAVKNTTLYQNGNIVRSTAHSDEMVFVDYWLFDGPPVQYYAGRSIVHCPDVQCVQERMASARQTSAIYFLTLGTGHIQTYQRISSEQL